MVDVLSMRWGSAAQCLVFLACLLSTCESTPKDYQRQQLLPVPPPPQSTESSDQFIDIFNKILQGFQDKDPGNFDGMNWYFGDTTDPVPEIPKLPQSHEEWWRTAKAFAHL
ncbi:uncharacterized protein [Ptychodera flava]|uniref:uncharacterized protein n=1 Tax=Ptychodera flava TaxID=63121 RepID=UPI00396A8D41